jgi:cellulose synthase/poly-beta-1,6-N-acetylglucosamine synthase-like glycosyltransferase
VIVWEWLAFSLWVPVGFLSVTSLWLGIQTMIATLPLRARQAPLGSRPPATILVPAHNEAAIIGDTLQSILGEINDDDRVLVVADNCSDDTASIARSYPSVEVLERTNDAQRGKGFALQFALETLRDDSQPMHSVVVMIDADCRLGKDAVNRLVTAAQVTGRPVQSLYRIGRGEEKSPSRMLSYLAITIKNHIRPLALRRMGMGNLLTGSGMAFPTATLRHVSLDSDNTADDVELGCELAMRGAIPTFCPDAVIDSAFPNESEDQGVQRKRWIHGHLRTMANFTPRLLWNGIRRFDGRQWIYALELAVPPLSLLVAAGLLLLPITATLAVLGQSPIQFGAVAVSLTLLTSSVLLSWLAFAKNEVPLRVLARLPQHLVFGVAASGQSLIRRQGWVNTPRSNSEVR